MATRKEIAYNLVLDQILNGTYKPGSRLSEEHIASAAGISATPVREAFRQLASEGLVEHIPNRGVFVHEVSAEEVDALYEARELLEVFAAEKAAYLASRRDVEIMRHFVETQHALCRKLRDSSEETLSGDDVTAWLEADVGFHMAMLKAAGNPVILKMVRECHIMSRLLGNFRHILSLRQISRTWLHHSRILRALRLKNPGRAAISMRLHIQFSFRTALMHFDSAMADGFPPYTHRTVEFVEQGKPQ